MLCFFLTFSTCPLERLACSGLDDLWSVILPFRFLYLLFWQYMSKFLRAGTALTFAEAFILFLLDWSSVFAIISSFCWPDGCTSQVSVEFHSVNVLTICCGLLAEGWRRYRNRGWTIRLRIASSNRISKRGRMVSYSWQVNSFTTQNIIDRRKLNKIIVGKLDWHKGSFV